MHRQANRRVVVEPTLETLLALIGLAAALAGTLAMKQLPPLPL